MMRSISPRMLSLTAAVLFGLGSSACGDGTEDGTSSSSGGSGNASASATPTSSNSNASQGATASGDDGGSGQNTPGGSDATTSTPDGGGNSTPTSGETTTGKETTGGETTTTTTTTTTGETTTEPEPAKITLEKDIQPIFNASCGCHTSNAAGGLSLKAGEAYGALLNKTGTKVGTLLTPNDPSKSAVYGVTAHTVEPVMPKNKPKIAADKIKLMEDWIKGGALEK